MNSGTGFLFFILFLLGCRSDQSSEITIVWRNDQATALSIPKALIGNSATDVSEEIRIVLSGDTTSNGIFGKSKIEGNTVVFEPLIPFTRGLSYTVRVGDKLLGTVKIPLPDHSDFAEVAGVYPSQDTLPENTLKMYIVFSKPIQKGQALKHLFLVRNNKDTIANPFLDMTNELWNADATVLTLWFDPGRVKRELQPNLLLGAPLEKRNVYQLFIDDQWRDARGSPLASVYSKHFLVGDRDSIMPDLGTWVITSPPTNSLNPLHIRMHEPLDYLLLQSSILLLDESGMEVRGKIELRDEEREIYFIPDVKWKKGSYTLQVESRLEDLAGNNLERPFDRDLNQELNTRTSEKQFTRKIVIQ